MICLLMAPVPSVMTKPSRHSCQCTQTKLAGQMPMGGITRLVALTGRGVRGGCGAGGTGLNEGRCGCGFCGRWEWAGGQPEPPQVVTEAVQPAPPHEESTLVTRCPGGTLKGESSPSHQYWPDTLRGGWTQPLPEHPPQPLPPQLNVCLVKRWPPEQPLEQPLEATCPHPPEPQLFLVKGLLLLLLLEGGPYAAAAATSTASTNARICKEVWG